MEYSKKIIIKVFSFFKYIYPAILILICVMSLLSFIVSNIDEDIIKDNTLKAVISLLKDNSLATLLLVFFIFEFTRNEKKQKNDSVILIEHNEFNSIVEKEFSRSDNISIILSSSRASFSTLQHIIDSNINKKLNIRILIKSPDALNDTRQALVISNVLKWFELKKNNNIKVAVKMYSDHEILRCYIFDNSRILAGIYSYKDTITECNSKNIQCERHRFYGHNYMLYYTGHNDRVGNFLLEKYQNQFEFMWSNSTSFNISDHTL